jgi:hypothetical protein
MEALSTQPRSASDSWSLLVAVWVAAAYAGFELLNAFVIEVPAGAIVFGLLFGGAWLWIRRGSAGGLVLLVVLCALELAFIPAYEYVTATDWIFSGIAAGLGLAGLVAGLRELARRRGARISAGARQ